MGSYEDAIARKATLNASGIQGQVKDTVSKLAPFATTYNTQDNLGTIAAQTVKKPAAGNAIEKLGEWAGGFLGGAGDIIAGGAKWLFQSTVDAIEAPFKLGASLGNAINLSANIDTQQKQTANYTAQMNQLSADFRAGKITRDKYKEGIANISANMGENNKAIDQTIAQVSENATNTANEALLVAGDVVTVLSLGASAGLTPLAASTAKTAVDGSIPPVINFFGQKTVTPFLLNGASKIDHITMDVINNINKVTTWGGKFSDGKIAAIVNESLEAGAKNLTAKELAKSAAMNVLIKRPLIYQTNIDLASDIYKDLQKGDLSGAALSFALVSTMALGNGPLGYALGTLKKTGSWLRDSSFVDGKVVDLRASTNLTDGTADKAIKEFTESQAKASVSRESFIDASSVLIGEGKMSQVYDYVLAEAQKGNLVPLQTWKVMEEVNMAMAGGNSVKAAKLWADHYVTRDGGTWLRKATAADVTADMGKHVMAREIAVADAIARGVPRDEAERIVVGRADQRDLGQIGAILVSADKIVPPVYKASVTTTKGTFLSGKVVSDMAESDYKAQLRTARHTLFNEAIDRYGRTAPWANNDNFIALIRNMIDSNVNSAELTKQIQAIRVGYSYGDVGKAAKKQLQDLGYMAILPKKTFTPYYKFEETNGVLKTQFAKDNPGFAKVAAGKSIAKGGASIFEYAVKPKPVLQSIANAFARIGLSPESAQDKVQAAFKANFAKAMANKEIGATAGDSETLLAQINNFMNSPTRISGHVLPIVDMRQLTVRDIQAATGIVDKKVVKQIMRSISNSFLEIPLSVRGLGDKILDINYKLNPLAAGYSRVQGATRFVWNPFFRWQQSYQTEGFVQLEVGGQKILQLPGLNFANKILFPKFTAKNDATIQLLESNGMFGKGLESMITGEALHGQVGTRLIYSEKVSLAGMVTQQAKKAGYGDDIQRYIDDNKTQILDTLRVITVSNSHKTGVLDSPLTRTINLAFFPFRYNLKVASLMADYVAKMNPATQVAIISSLYNFNDFISSDAGIAWQTTHAEAVSLFNWLSPTYPLSYVMKLAGDVAQPENASIGDLGLLGGLPFGFISQLLESEGIIDASAPYVNPKTGDVLPKYVPNTTRAQIAVAIQDLLGSMFSYPGAKIGLPSKGSLQRGLTNATIGGANEYDQIDISGKLTPEQQNQQKVIKATQGTAQPTAPVSSPAPTTTTVPGTTITPTVKAKKTTSKKKKKSEFRPRPIT